MDSGNDEDQPHVHYAKGSVAMFALQNHVGEDVINAALREFINEHKFTADGKKTLQFVNDFIDIELSNEKGEKLLIRERLSFGNQQIKLTTTFTATKVTVDLNRLLIDRNANDNTFEQ
ncbi:MAG: hypothetical protein ACJAZY_003674 [Spirosomataceae bacterium]